MLKQTLRIHSEDLKVITRKIEDSGLKKQHWLKKVIWDTEDILPFNYLVDIRKSYDDTMSIFVPELDQDEVLERCKRYGISLHNYIRLKLGLPLSNNN